MKALVRGIALLSLAGLFTGCATPGDQGQSARLTIRTFIDGADSLMVRGDQVWFEHHAYELPGQWLGGDEPTIVNHEQKWHPVWKGSLSDKLVLENKEAALPPNKAFTAETLAVKVKGGWGRVDVSQYPTAENDYTLVLTVDDRGPNGAYWYNIGIDWDDAVAK